MFISQLTSESVTVICTTVGAVLTLIATNYFSNRKLQITLEQARLDRAQDRVTREEDKNEILDAGAERKNQILGEVKQVKTVAVKAALKSEQALNAANNLTEKHNNTIDIATKALEKINKEPIEVTVVNDNEHPVPTTNETIN